LEDNRLVDPPRLSGPDGRLTRARDEHELYFKAHPTETDRDYLLHVFAELRKLPGGKEIFGEHNPIYDLPKWLSGDAAGELLKFFQRIDANTGALIHDFTDPSWDTRFLGDLYQDLSETARKKYALLQTPVFVEEFILDRTLDPAIDEFGLEGFRMIDPASGSGHFLLGSLHRILQRWLKKEPSTNVRVLVQRTLDSVNGVDVNPYAVAISRFRLLLVALRESGISRLQDAPDFHFNLAIGDSLLHGIPGREQEVMGFHELAHHYQSEDLPALRRILSPGTYHAVVANPPYIKVKDRALNEAYRVRYSSCRGKYSLAVPFLERIFQLPVAGGYTGQITANSFMKRSFGKDLIEKFFPTVDLTHVIDTSLAYIPGHGTPTVILLGRMRRPVASVVRCALGIRRENEEPTDPAKGLVWSSILALIDVPGAESEFVSVSDLSRDLFHNHPWSIGGGGAAELKEMLHENTATVLSDIVSSIGITAFTLADDVFFLPRAELRRRRLPASNIREVVVGDAIRDWQIIACESVLFPYDSEFAPIPPDPRHPVLRSLWRWRVLISNNKMFGGKTKVECGLLWYEYGRLTAHKLRTPLSITFANIATHNHFALDRGGRIFEGHAPIIKLPPDASEDEHLGLIGLLNSSTGSFWMKQTFYHRGGGGIGGGIAAEAWERFYEHDGTKMKQFPIPETRPLFLSKTLDDLGKRWQKCSPASLLRSRIPTSLILVTTRAAMNETLNRMISVQEELDWLCYRFYGVIEEDLNLIEPPCLKLGQRAFEVVLARKIAAGETQTTWFERHGSTPITELPTDWPDDYRRVVERRIALIESDPNVRLIEQPEYKRRWNIESWESQLVRALREWLLDRLESHFDFDGRMNEEGKPTAQFEIQLISVTRLADIVRQDNQFMRVGELYRDDSAFDVQKLIEELVGDESVPLLPVLRYKDSGRRKRVEWEQTWDLQRREDAIDAQTKLSKDHPDYLTQTAAEDLKKRQIGDISVPPKYTTGDFLDNAFWRLRGKLDVPKERWVSFPYCEGEDGQMVIAWAGYDHLQLARAISAYYVDIQEHLGGRDDPRLVPLLACLVELLPWLKQWHDGTDPEFKISMADYFEDFVQEEARQMGKTVDEIKNWEPPKKSKKPAKKKTVLKEDPESRLEV
jgi:hypothetical protein